MIKFVKIATTVMALLVVTLSFSGCGKNEETSHTHTKADSISVWTTMDSNTAVSYTNYNEMMFYQEMEKRTGIKVNFIHPIAGSTGAEAFLTMLTSKEIPDVMEYNWNSYTGGAQKAIEDEVIISLNDYLQEYAPNYYEYMEGEKGKANDYLYKYQSTTEDGQYYGFANLAIGSIRCFEGLAVRGDKLKEWGIDIPTTIDEWTQVFAMAKENGFKTPFTSIYYPLAFNSTWCSFNTAFNVGKGFYIEDGKVVFAPFQDGFKEYVAQLAQWCELGYLDEGYITNAFADAEGKLVNEESIAGFIWISDIGNLTTAARTNNPDFELVACPYPVAEKGDISRYQSMSDEVIPQAFAISYASDKKETAIGWCDYIYSEEGNILRTFGIEGDTYTTEEIDGEKHYNYTDKITVPENSGVTSIAQAIYKYCIPANHPGLTQHPDYLNGYYPLDIQQEAVEVWNKNVHIARENRIPENISYTIEETKEKTDILEIAENELEIAINDIILGKQSIDTYDAAIAKAKENGYNRLIEIHQASYDRYINKFSK